MQFARFWRYLTWKGHLDLTNSSGKVAKGLGDRMLTVHLGYSFRLKKEAKSTTTSVLSNSLRDWAIPRAVQDRDS